MSLRTRLDKALDYLEAHPEIPVVLTGGTGYGEEISEAACMYDYLTAHGVEAGAADSGGSGIQHGGELRLLLGTADRGGGGPGGGTGGCCHQRLSHRPGGADRRPGGLRRRGGIPAPLPWVHLEINYTLREAFAMVKTFLFD